MKRLLLICLALILVLSLCSCKLFDKKLFGDPDDKTVSEDPADKSDDKTEDKAPEDKSEDAQNTDGKTEDSADPSTGDGQQEENPKGSDSSQSSGGYTHVHSYTIEEPTDEYASEEQADYYYYHCVCGARGTETFYHQHNYDQKEPIDKYASEEQANYYYYHCVCGARGTETFYHVHVYDQKVIAEAYATDPDNYLNDAESYYYSCSCGARGSATFPHEHKWKNIVAERYLVSKVVSSEDVDTEEGREALKYQYYPSCEECGKIKHNGVFDTRDTSISYSYLSDLSVAEDKPYYGELISGTPTN